MQRNGPPPSYPNLKIPGLNAPKPEGTNYGFNPGDWGKPPVDEKGRPIYGDVFGSQQAEDNADEEAAEAIEEQDVRPWGQLESESEEEEESSSEEDSAEEDESGDEDATGGLETPAAGTDTPASGMTSTMTAGVETPDQLELRKRRVIESAMEDSGEEQSLYKVLPSRDTNLSGFMASSHVYDMKAADVPKSGKVAPVGGLQVSIDPEELEGLSEEDKQKRSDLIASVCHPIPTSALFHLSCGVLATRV
jgi:splicing factor 3B subunit 2